MELNAAARAAFDAMREGITIIDTEGCIVFGNRAYRDFLNKEAGAISARSRATGCGICGPAHGFRMCWRRSAHPPHHPAGDPGLLFRQSLPNLSGRSPWPAASVVTFLEDAYQTQEELEAVERRSRQVLRSISRANGAKYTFDDIVAVTPAAAQVKALAEKIAATDATVLLESESGTGKELYAQAIHNHSPSAGGGLRGHQLLQLQPQPARIRALRLCGGGLYRGQKRGQAGGSLRPAAGGTLFLDEISEMDLASRPSCSGCFRSADPSGGRRQGAGHGCAGHCRLQREPPGLCGPGPVPQGSLLPAKHLSRPHPAPFGSGPATFPPWPAPSWTTSPQAPPQLLPHRGTR